MTAPLWALRIVEDQCFLHDVPTARLQWYRKRDSFYSSGRAHSYTRQEEYGARRDIHVTAGTDRADQKLVLLHEIAHYLTPDEETHSPAFWDKAWELYRYYGLPFRAVLEREGTYRQGAVDGARRAGYRVSAKREAAMRRYRR